MRLAAALVLGLSLAAPARAQSVPMDTLVVRHVGPGMTYFRLVAPSIPWSIDVLELDRTNPYLDVEMVEAFDRRAGGFETVSSMAARRERPGRHVVGAVNGDFFSGGGDTINAGVVGGQVVRRGSASPAQQPSIAFDASNAMSISRPTVGGVVLTASDTLQITGYNEPRSGEALVFYNTFQGTTTATDGGGTEVVIRPTVGWVVNDTVTVVVEQVTVGAGGTAIPEGWAVLSASGPAATALGALSVGEDVRVVATVQPGLPRIEDLISGRPTLLRNGQRFPIANNDHNLNRHPRTAVGVNADTSRIYFVTVDGRQSSSAGMTNFEMQDVMLAWGMTDAIGLDGGGSTTMVIRGEIANSPSGSERAVGNALLAVSTAPVGPLAHLQASPALASLFLGESVQLSVSGADAYYNPLPIDIGAVTFRVDASLGTVAPDGLFTANAERDEPVISYVYVEYGALTDSVRVSLRVVDRIDIEPSMVVTDTLLSIPFSALATDSDGVSQALPQGRVTWQVLDPAVGDLSADGVFVGRAVGSTQVVASYSDAIRDTAYVEVQVGSGTLRLDPLDEATGWDVVSDRMEEAELDVVEDPQATGGKALRVRYRFVRGDQPPSLQMQTRIRVYGVPDSLRVRVRTDGARYILRYLLENSAADPLSLSVPRYADDTEFAWMPGPFTRVVPAVDLSYPVVVTGVEIVLPVSGVAMGEEVEGTLVFDDLWVSYPSAPVETGVAVPPDRPGGFLRVFPNPSTGMATVEVATPRPGTLRVSLYDALGRSVLTLLDTDVAPGTQTVVAAVDRLPAGTYLVRATLDGRALDGGTMMVVLR